MLKSGACLAFAMLAAPPALACTDAQLQVIANRYFALSEASLKPAPIVEALRQDLVTCATEPAAHKIGALAFSVMAQRESANGPVAIGYAEEAMRAVLTMQAIMGSKPTIRNVSDRNGALTPIRFDDSYDVSKRALHLLLALESRAGRPISFAALSKPDDQPLNCDIYAGSMAQQAVFWMKDQKTLTPGGSAFLDRLLSACADADYDGLSIRGYRIDLLLSAVEAAPAGANALAWLRQAQADSDAIFAQRPEGLHIGWKTDDLSRLERATWSVASASAVSLPTDQWFTPQNLGKPLTVAVIASELDLAYAKDLAPGGVTTNPLYRGVLSSAFTAARALPEPQARQARRMLHLAATRHAEGGWRREANKALKKPADYFYNWIDPDYRPPPTAPVPGAP